MSHVSVIVSFHLRQHELADKKTAAHAVPLAVESVMSPPQRKVSTPIIPILREKEQGTLTLPDDDPETTRKRKEAEKVRMWENSLAADDDESF